MTEVTDKDRLDFLLSCMRSEPSMDGNHRYRFQVGWNSSHLVGNTPLEAVDNAVCAIREMEHDLKNNPEA